MTIIFQIHSSWKKISHVLKSGQSNTFKDLHLIFLLTLILSNWIIKQKYVFQRPMKSMFGNKIDKFSNSSQNFCWPKCKRKYPQVHFTVIKLCEKLKKTSPELIWIRFISLKYKKIFFKTQHRKKYSEKVSQMILGYILYVMTPS